MVSRHFVQCAEKGDYPRWIGRLRAKWLRRDFSTEPDVDLYRKLTANLLSVSPFNQTSHA